MTTLIFYFGPFGSDNVNSSQEAARLLPASIGRHMIVQHRLPVSFKRAAVEAMATATTLRPDTIICLGQAARSEVCLERMAVNIAHATACADNDGYMPKNEKIVPEGPDTVTSRLPVDEIALTLRQKGHKVSVSDTAGRFVCNALYYSLLYQLESIPTLFIHVPLTPGQATLRPDLKATAMPSHQAAAAISLVVESC